MKLPRYAAYRDGLMVAARHDDEHATETVDDWQRRGLDVLVCGVPLGNQRCVDCPGDLLEREESP